MKSKFNHSELVDLVNQVKICKMCDDVAIALEKLPISDEVLFSDVIYEGGILKAQFYFSYTNDLKSLLTVLDPMPLAKVGYEAFPIVLAEKMGWDYECLNSNVYRIDTDTIQCYAMIGDQTKSKYLVSCILQFIRR